MKTWANSNMVWKELEKVLELPKYVIECHIHFRLNEPVTIETIQIAHSVDGINDGEIKKKWKLEEIND